MLKDRASDIGLLILLCPEVQPCSVWTALPFPVRHISRQMCLVRKLNGKRFGFGRLLGGWTWVLPLYLLQ